MKAALVGACALLATGCMTIVEEVPADAGPDAAVPPNGGGGAGTCLTPPCADNSDAGPGDLDAGLNWGNGDGGGGQRSGFPGSGKSGDTGTGILVLVRIDQGTYNVASTIETTVRDLAAAAQGAGLYVQSIVVAPLYSGGAPNGIWLSVAGSTPQTTLGNALRGSVAVWGQTTDCTTNGLYAAGQRITALNPNPYGNVFVPAPNAMLIALVDTGPRVTGTNCPYSGSTFASTPYASWMSLWPSLPRPQTRYLLLGTSESESAAQMRSRCASLPGVPASAIDALAPSPVLFDSMVPGMNGYQAALASRVDLCEAFSSSWPTRAASLMSDWVDVLKAQP